MNPEIQKFAEEFIAAYYTTIAYDSRNVFKFYDQEKAEIFRQNLSPKQTSNIKQAKHVLAPNLSSFDKLSIINYSFNQFGSKNNFLNVHVFGKQFQNNKIINFAQHFTLEIIGDKMVIISDSLNTFTNDQEDAEVLIEYENPNKAPQRSSGYINKQKKEKKAKKLSNPFIFRPGQDYVNT